MRRSLACHTTVSFLLLLAAGCDDPSPSAAAIPSLAAAPAADTGDSAAPEAWSDAVGRRFMAEDAAFYPASGGLRAVQPLQGLEAVVGADGTALQLGEERVTLRTVSIGREGAAPTARLGEPQLGACVPGGVVDMEDNCIARVERTVGGAVEWWASTPGQVEFGWELDEAPVGRGLLEIVVATEGGELSVEADGASATLAADRSVGISGLLVWDEAGAVLPAWMEARGNNLIFVMDDSEAQGAIYVDPYTFTAGRTWNGSASSYFGRSVAAAGDVNLDGYADVIVGSPNYSSSTGRAYVYQGSSSGIGSSVSTTLTGATTGISFGRSVSGDVDVNRDGFDDVIVGADGVSSNTGAAYVFYGSSTGISGTADVTLAGSASSYFGFSVSGAGDVNHDGYDDVVIGAYGLTSLTGAAYVYHGSSTGLSTTATTTLSGSTTVTSFGASVARAGDVNHDSYADVIVGAFQASSNTGYASVYHGSASGLSSTATSTISGASAGENLGISVACAGDVNADTYDDVIVGSYGYSSYVGRAQVFHGSSTGVSTTATTSISGPATSYFGYAVAGAGDIDDDGYDDVVVGGYVYSSSSGIVRTYAGSTSGVSSSYTGTVTGSASTCLGFAVAGVGDTNGDGYADIAAGGYCASSSQGTASVYYGQADVDGDGYFVGTGVSTSSLDCDDTSATVHPGATEVINDGIDQDCDTKETCYDDDDNDGYLDTTADTRLSTDLDCADAYEGTATDPTTDCDDTDSGDYPGAAETTGNGDDENCDGAETCYDDDDDDGYLDTTGDTRASTDTDCNDTYEGRSSDPTTDCDDTDSGDHPGAPETIGNGDDENCDGAETCYDDDDDDGYLDTTNDTRSSTDMDCTDAYEGTSADPTTDCDDTNSAKNPGATEIVGDGIDENCDLAETCYDDDDNDGYLDTTADTRASTDLDCADSYEGTSTDLTTDCDDTSALIKPGVTEITGDSVDQNCDGVETCYDDDDNDGYLDTTADTRSSSDTDCSDAFEGKTSDPTTDCNDAFTAVHPGATEIVGDGIDEDCDNGEVCYDDDDDDGYLDSSGDTRVSTDTDCSDAYEAPNTDPTTDCDDTTATTYPGATDAVADGIDSDCSTTETCYTDADGDGYAVATTLASADTDCTDPGEASATVLARGLDCDDATAGTNPAATEVVGDEIDADCDGGERCYADADGDGYSDGATVVSADADCADAGEVTATAYAAAQDCNDADAGVSPGGAEVCDGANVDEDCNGVADDADTGTVGITKSRFYADVDGDGYGDAASPLDRCDPPSGYVTDSTDCNDADSSIHPGATERCDAADVDEDCDGTADDADTEATGKSTWYFDWDTDGFGGTVTIAACDLPAGYVADSTDCEDHAAAINPAATEVCDASDTDEDCDGKADDADASVDASTFTTWYADADGDTYGDLANTIATCDVPVGYGTDTADCDDADALIHPGAEERVGDEVDSDCDLGELCYADLDRDGWGGLGTVPSADVSCADAGEVSAATYALGSDCDDGNALVNPDATEVCDAADVDEDCNGLAEDADPGVTGQLSLWVDADGDLYGSEATNLFACDPTEGYATELGDCNDGDAEVHPGAEETCNEVDDDCDLGVDEDAVDAPVWYPDSDTDGFGGSLGVAACAKPEGYVNNDDDCDEENAEVNPGAEETCNDLDDDCDGVTDPESLCGTVQADPATGCDCESGGAGAGMAAMGMALVLAGARRRR